MDNICNLPGWQHITIILIVQLIIGFINLRMSKAETIKSNSVEELILRTIGSMVKRLFTKGQ
jgi:uncharacterized membrane-anchored protein YhcB (DUF1043 family)